MENKKFPWLKTVIGGAAVLGGITAIVSALKKDKTEANSEEDEISEVESFDVSDDE